MWKTAEPANDVSMPQGMGKPGLAESDVESDRQVLVVRMLGVGKRQTEEQSQISIDRVHVPCR